MKKIILITILAISVIKTKAQTTGVPDTLAYLQNIVSNKANYIGQPFSVLENNLQIHIKYFFPYADLSYDEAKETSTSFSFYFPPSVDDYYLTYPRLLIKWQPYLNKNQSNIIRASNNNKGKWNTEAEIFYSSAIIADIQIRE